MNVLTRIKRLVLKGRYIFTEKAAAEIDFDDLSEDDVVESILSARRVVTKRSTSSDRLPADKVYILTAPNFSGLWIYTKGVIRRLNGDENFYILISAKKER